jgi:uncharacterized membrane protein
MSNEIRETSSDERSNSTVSAGIVVDGRYIPPPQDKDGKLWVRTSALIKGEPQRLYDLWRAVERAPQWQEQIIQVTVTGGRTSHWLMRSGQETLEWDSQILADEPGRRIAWKSIGGELENAGEVIFDRAPGDRGTIVTVLQEFRMGKWASAWETLFGRNPKQAVVENLRHFKALAETGEIPTTQGQPHGPRGTVAEAKKSMYGEKIPTPPGGDLPAKKARGAR